MPIPTYPQVDLNQQNYWWVVNTIKELQAQMASGAAGLQVITLASQMTDTSVIYIYKGTEVGYNTGHWYYWDTGLSAWTDGGAFGFDTSLLPISVTNGGTGSTNVSDARTALGLGTMAVLDAPLPIASGGTGQTTAAAARNALGLGNTTGALPIANGGTGQTTAAAARNALGLGNTTGALPIANGGTGQVTLADAQTALGIVTPARYVTEKGTHTSGWEYEKYSDGTCKLWITVEQTVSATWSLWNCICTSSASLDPPAYPWTFNAPPHVTFNGEGLGGSSGFYCNQNGDAVNPPHMNGWRPAAFVGGAPQAGSGPTKIRGYFAVEGTLT